MFQAICLAPEYSTFDLPFRTKSNEIKIGETRLFGNLGRSKNRVRFPTDKVQFSEEVGSGPKIFIQQKNSFSNNFPYLLTK